MAFDINAFDNVTSGSSLGPRIWSYGSSTDTLAEISASGYFNDVKFRIEDKDLVYVSGSDGAQFVKLSSQGGEEPVTTTVWLPSSGGGGGGTINSGTENQIAYYASTGTTISGLTGANSALLVTNGSGVPSMLPGPGANSRTLISINGDVPAWTDCTYPNSVSQYSVLYANFTNAISSVVSTPRAIFTTASTGEPTWVPVTDGQIVIGSTAGSPAAASLTAGTGISITPGSNSITIAATGGGGGGEGAKFWLKASGDGTTILDSFNVASITDTMEGALTVTIDTDFANANWCLNLSAQNLGSAGYIPTGNTQAAGSVLVAFTNASGALRDPDSWYVSGFGDQ